MIELFHPNIPKNVYKEVKKTLESKWIAQGPKVKEFETEFAKQVSGYYPVATNSTTGALHLAYIMSGIKDNDEVITTVLTCTATNLPILWLRAIPVFADIQQESLNISPEDVEKKITSKTKAIVCVNYAGLPCEFDKLRKIADKYNLKLICDNAHGIRTTYKGLPIENYCDYVIYSFQAIKFMTTGDGGMIVCKTLEEANTLKKLRWFGINKEEKMSGRWNGRVDIVGYKYHMNDLAATIGLASLKELDKTLERYKKQFELYKKYLGEYILHYSYDFIPWLCTIRVNNADKISKHLEEVYGIETGKIHYRNDIYEVFGGKRLDLFNMNIMEDRYLVLPMCCTTKKNDIKYISNAVKNAMRNI